VRLAALNLEEDLRKWIQGVTGQNSDSGILRFHRIHLVLTFLHNVTFL